MIRKTLFILLSITTLQVSGWGLTGHRAIGEIAEKHLNKRAGKKLAAILGKQSLAEISNWMDMVRSDSSFDHTHDWHWVTIPEDKKYEETDKNTNGDIIQTIERLILELKTGGLSQNQEVENIKFLTHLIGDIHQPLHVGTGNDRGGNDIKVTWFWEDYNLHRVWDTGLIDQSEYSYTELAEVCDKADVSQIKLWQSSNVRDWAYESMALRHQVYDVPDHGNINYKYRYANWNTVMLRVEQAGIRLAGVLNDIYGK